MISGRNFCTGLLALTVAGAVHASTTVKVDSFTWIKGGTLPQWINEEVTPAFRDEFADGNPPPSAPNFANDQPASYQIRWMNNPVGDPPAGAVSEAGGLLSMDPIKADQDGGYRALRVRLLTNVSEVPENAAFGINRASSHAVIATYPIDLPLPNESYGVRLNDGHSDSNDIVAMQVTNVDGVLVVYLARVLPTFSLIDANSASAPPGAQFISLILAHENADSGLIRAFYTFLDGSRNPVGSWIPLAQTVEVFRGENKTRAELIASTPIRSIIDHYYQSILGRAADAGGRAFWRDEAVRMTRLKADIAEAYIAMANTFLNQPEFLNANLDDGAFVDRMYETFFDRSADGGGRSYWVSQLQGGLAREMVILGFMFSSEFETFMESNAGSSTSRPEVYAVLDFYRGSLGRLPDDGGLNFWAGEFREAQCLPEAQRAGGVYNTAISIADQFFGSAEYEGKATSNERYVSDLYNAFMRRSASPADVAFWVGKIQSADLTRYQVRRAFIDSPEFGARVSSVAGAGCI